MNLRILAPALALAAAAAPARAAEGPFFSLYNTDFVVLIGFLIFIGVLVYFKVPGILGGLLDKRADGIRSDLDEARGLREEAQALLASYERKQREVAEQADRIVAKAKADAENAAEAAKADLERAIARRVKAAEEQVVAAEAAAMRDVRNRAIALAVAAAGDAIAAQMSAKDAGAFIDGAIADVGALLN